MSYVIDRLDDYGRGITVVDNKICFVTNALPTEEIDIELINDKKNFKEANQTKIIKENSNRKISECPYFLECGGCDILHMNYNYQLEFKRKKVEGILSKFANLNNVVKEILPTKEFIYRNKISLKVLNGKLGYFEKKSNKLIEIDKCILCSGAINETIKKLKVIDLKSINEIIIRSNYKSEILLCLKGEKIDKNYYLDKLKKIDNIVIIDNKNKEVIKGNDYIIDKIDDLSFKISTDSFFQVNSYGVSILYNKVLEYAGNNKNVVLDLYCGTGTIGLFLSKKAKKVYGVEINKSAVIDANYNKDLNSISNIEFLCDDVANIKEKYNNIDLVVIDPPRIGLSKDAIKNVLDINSKNIIYVSCDPVTLARDLNIIKNTYEVKEITIVDMFPNTYHVECVCLLMKK